MSSGWGALSLLFRYPEPDLWDDLPELEAAADELPGPRRRPLRRFLAHLAAAGPEQAQREYVDAFDFDRRAGLELTYHLHGDRRERGMALVRLQRLYRSAGLRLGAGELPDHLAVLLEFADRVEGGERLLASMRPSLEIVRARLAELGSSYGDAIEAVILGLPRLTPAEAERTRRLAADGPPAELVGLEPFAAAPAEVAPR